MADDSQKPEPISDAITAADKALRESEQSYGAEHVLVADKLEHLAQLLRNSKVRLLDAVNMEARAKLIRQRTTAGASQSNNGDDTRTCPYCAETIKKAAALCRHCGSKLEEAALVQASFTKVSRWFVKHCRSRRRLLLGLVAVIGFWYFASPYYTAMQLKAAIEKQEPKAIAQLVDFVSLKDSVRSQLESVNVDSDKRLINISLQMVSRFLMSELKSSGSSKDQPVNYLERLGMVQPYYISLNTFALSTQIDESKKTPLILILQRKNLFDWQLSAIQLDESSLSKIAKAKIVGSVWLEMESGESNIQRGFEVLLCRPELEDDIAELRSKENRSYWGLHRDLPKLDQAAQERLVKSAETDVSGGYVIPNITPGKYVVYARCKVGYLSSAYWLIPVQLTGLERLKLDLDNSNMEEVESH